LPLFGRREDIAARGTLWRLARAPAVAKAGAQVRHRSVCMCRDGALTCGCQQRSVASKSSPARASVGRRRCMWREVSMGTSAKVDVRDRVYIRLFDLGWVRRLSWAEFPLRVQRLRRPAPCIVCARGHAGRSWTTRRVVNCTTVNGNPSGSVRCPRRKQ